MLESKDKKDFFLFKKYKEIYHKIKNLRNTNLEVGLCHYYMDNIFDAKLRFNCILKFNPQDTEAMYNLGRCYLKKGKFQKAVDIFQKLSDSHKMAKYQYDKIINSEIIETIPNTIINEKLHHTAIYKIYHDCEDQYLQKTIINIIYKHCNTEQKINILDICCQNGSIALYIKKRGLDCNICGYDLTHLATDHCQKITINNKEYVYNKLFNKNISTLLDVDSDADAEEQKYDIVICINHLSYHKNLYTTFKKIRQLLNESGIAIITLFNTDSVKRELNEINDYFCFNEEYVKNTADKNGMIIKEHYSGKSSLFIDSNSSIYVLSNKQ